MCVQIWHKPSNSLSPRHCKWNEIFQAPLPTRPLLFSQQLYIINTLLDLWSPSFIAFNAHNCYENGTKNVLFMSLKMEALDNCTNYMYFPTWRIYRVLWESFKTVVAEALGKVKSITLKFLEHILAGKLCGKLLKISLVLIMWIMHIYSSTSLWTIVWNFVKTNREGNGTHRDEVTTDKGRQKVLNTKPISSLLNQMHFVLSSHIEQFSIMSD